MNQNSPPSICSGHRFKDFPPLEKVECPQNLIVTPYLLVGSIQGYLSVDLFFRRFLPVFRLEMIFQVLFTDMHNILFVLRGQLFLLNCYVWGDPLGLD